VAIVSGRRAKRPDGGVYRQMRRQRLTRGAVFRRRASRAGWLLGILALGVACWYGWKSLHPGAVPTSTIQPASTQAAPATQPAAETQAAPQAQSAPETQPVPATQAVPATQPVPATKPAAAPV
jgi:hypothetical protein